MTTLVGIPRRTERPIGYFVHHQGRGHAERCADLIQALPSTRPVTVFCAEPDCLPALPPQAEVRAIPSLFEATGAETPMDQVPQPATVHCAPLGWPGIRRAMGGIAAWFADADPALIVTDVSAEIAQLARLCSVPHVAVLQHGDRNDPGHHAAYDGAAGLLAPCAAPLAQPDWDRWRDRIHFAGGLGVRTAAPGKAEARARLGLSADAPVVVVISGGGGNGIGAAPLAVGARAVPEAHWITIGHVASDWHATEPDNLSHHGWVDAPMDYVAAADVVIASTGNTTCHQILAVGRPWLAVPEWRYFDEQVEKARALDRAGAATHMPSLPASIGAWRRALAQARDGHDAARQRALVRPDAAANAAAWLDDLAKSLWASATSPHDLPLAGE